MRFPRLRFAFVCCIIFLLLIMVPVFDLFIDQPISFPIAVILIGDIAVVFLGYETTPGNPGMSRPKRFTLRRCVRMAWLLAGLLLLQMTLAAMSSDYILHWMNGDPLPNSDLSPEVRHKCPRDATIFWYHFGHSNLWLIALAIWGLMTGLIWHRIRPLPSGASPMAPPPKPAAAPPEPPTKAP